MSQFAEDDTDDARWSCGEPEPAEEQRPTCACGAPAVLVSDFGDEHDLCADCRADLYPVRLARVAEWP